jgi:ubiquinone/menaquinone biosynthesis C-methylase UbiE
MSEYDIFAPYYDLMHRYVKDISFYVKEAKKAKGKVLEIACGTGRLTIPIAKAGVDITGLDYSKDMLAVLRKKIKGMKNKPKIKYGDMRTFKLKDRFNLIFVPFNSFLYLKTQEDQLKALKNFKKHLKKGGKLIVNIFFPNMELILKKNNKLIREKSKDFKNPATGNKIRAWVLPKYDVVNQSVYYTEILKEFKGKKVVRTIKLPAFMRYIWKNEFELLLQLAGFKKWKLYGGFKYQKLTPKREQVWIIQK